MIEILDIHKSFNSHHVLSGVNLKIETGESMVVLGGSGTGKSVLLKIIMGLLKPDQGQVFIDGQDIIPLKEEGLGEIRKKFGMLFQGAALFDSLSVWKNVGFGLMEHTSLSKKEIRDIATQKLAMVGLKDIEDKMPAELSGGMKKRVGLARAIAMNPEIILYDEPTTGLDPIMADVINELIIKLKHEINATSVAITHDMTSAYKIGDRLALLYQGKIHRTGTSDEFKSSEDPVVHQFVTGSSVGPIEVTF
ncbi:MAG: ABC transporter ATP-binding protein [Nitrospirae bacterium]|nr:ABC transporter ATP-binding protein [Nitrospirota bacterium]MBI3353180.1 ABC transporter ATP-binding protein [Nitrospirota bacterium]